MSDPINNNPQRKHHIVIMGLFCNPNTPTILDVDSIEEPIINTDIIKITKNGVIQKTITVIVSIAIEENGGYEESRTYKIDDQEVSRADCEKLLILHGIDVNKLDRIYVDDYSYNPNATSNDYEATSTLQTGVRPDGTKFVTVENAYEININNGELTIKTPEGETDININHVEPLVNNANGARHDYGINTDN